MKKKMGALRSGGGGGGGVGPIRKIRKELWTRDEILKRKKAIKNGTFWKKGGCSGGVPAVEAKNGGMGPVRKMRKELWTREEILKRRKAMKNGCFWKKSGSGGAAAVVAKDCVCGFKPCLENSNGLFWIRFQKLGKGGFGTVFLAKRRQFIAAGKTQLPISIAVKSAPSCQSSSLVCEFQVLSDLSRSPYVVRCFGVESTKSGTDDVFNLLLEYCSGLSLAHRIRSYGSGLPESDVRSYTRDVVRGLAYIHEHRYVHCDIKPENILLAPDPNGSEGGYVAKIGDFGLAVGLFGDNENGFCPSLRGTYQFMSPELIRDNRIGYSADIWALGCTVIEMLSGRPPWEISDDDQLTYVIGYSDRLPEIPSGITSDARDFILMCLNRKAADRWTAEQLLQHPFLM